MPKLIYDGILGDIRTAKVRIGSYDAVFTCNVGMKSCTVSISSQVPFYPDIQILKEGPVLTYPHTVILPGNEDDFLNAFLDARRFCDEYLPLIRTIKENIAAERPALPEKEEKDGEKQ